MKSRVIKVLLVVVVGLSLSSFLLSVIGSSLWTSGLFFISFLLMAKQWRSYRSESLRLRQELEDARQTQIRLIPKSAPSLGGFEIAGISCPSREVGGDFFDYLPLADGRTGIAIADISGKGLKGAMSAVLVNGMLWECAKREASCGRILSVLNEDLYPRIERHMFAALGFAILGENSKKLQWSNAAQPHPIIKRGNQVFEFESEAELPLGMVPSLSYSDWDLELQAGDVIALYTDGVIEAESEVGEMYGIERLEQAIDSLDSGQRAREMAAVISQDVNGFAGGSKQYDDITIVVIKKL